MTSPSRYPFSDLTPEQVRESDRAPRATSETRAVRNFFAGFSAGERKVPVWPRRQREAQVWPPKNVPALSLTVYR